MTTTKTGAHLYSNREEIAALARTWLGTPYHHQAYVKGVGADCLGLLRGMFIEMYGHDPEAPPRYSEAWGEADAEELLLQAAQTHLAPVDYPGYKLADVLVFRVKNAVSAKHCAIVSGPDLMIHAVSAREVLETSIGAWSTRIAGVFKFPGVT